MEINFLHAFEAALLNPSLYNRCQAIKQLAENASTKALHNIFPRLVHDIFGVNRPGWGLTTLTSARLTDYQAAKNFLGVKGGMMMLLNKLQHDTSLPKFEMNVPTSSNPLDSLNMEYSWAYNQGYNSNSTQTLVKVQLSAYEYYFCHFAECITKEQISSQQNYLHQINFSGVMHRTALTSTNDDCLYFSLFNDYLHYFFPADGSTPPTMPAPGHHSLQISYQQYYSRADVIVRRQNQPYACQNANFEVWCSDFLLHTFIDYWLNVQQISTKLSPTSKQTLPIENQIRALRQLIKHLHYFVNSDTTLSHSNPEATLGLSQVTNTITTTFYCHVLDFLVYCFDIWPLDASFRVVLETWLSFIQPWRYTNIHDNQNDQRLSDKRDVANSWYGFISTNIDFYITLFKKVVNRFVRMDLSSMRNTYLLFRVARIFSQPNLLDLVDAADEALNVADRPSRSGYNSIGSYLHTSYPSRQTTGTSLGGVKTLFNEDFIEVMHQLLKVCAQALVNIKQNGLGSNSQSSWSTGLLKAIGLGPLMEANSSMMTDNAENSAQDSSRTVQHLEQAIDLLAKSFELDKPDLKRMALEMSNSRKKSSQNLPDHFFNAKGEFVLTDKGKYEIISQEKQAPAIPQRHPDLMPITSGENAFLVRGFYKLCRRINTPSTLQYLNNICSRDDFIGKISSHLFVPRHDIRSPVKLKYEPRISLRFWAHYRTIFYFFMWLILSWLFVKSAPHAVIYGLIFLVFYVFIDILATK